MPLHTEYRIRDFDGAVIVTSDADVAECWSRNGRQVKARSAGFQA